MKFIVFLLAIISAASCQRAQIMQMQNQANSAFNNGRNQIESMINRLPPPFSTFGRMFAMPFLTMASTAQSVGNSAMSTASNMIPNSVRSGMGSNMMRQRPWGGQMGGMGQGGQMGGMGQGGPMGGMGQGQMGGMGQGGPMGQMGGMGHMMGGRPGMMGQGMGGMGQGMGGMNPAIGQAVSMMSQYIQSPEGQQMIQMARVALAHASRAFMESIQQQTSGQQSMDNNNSMGGSSSMGGQLGTQFGRRPMGGQSTMGQPSMGQSSGQGSMQAEDQNSMGMRSAVGAKSEEPKVETPKA